MNSVKIDLMKVKKWFLVPLFLSIASFLVFALSPSTIDGDGTLQEPFFLILLGYLFLFVSMFMLALTFFRQE